MNGQESFIDLSPSPLGKQMNKHNSRNISKDEIICTEVLYAGTNWLFLFLQHLPRLQSTSPPLPWRTPPSVTRPASRRGNFTMTKDGEFEVSFSTLVSYCFPCRSFIAQLQLVSPLDGHIAIGWLGLVLGWSSKGIL